MHLLTALFPVYTCGMAISTIFIMLAAIILPNFNDSDAVKNNELAWRLFVGFPMILHVLTGIGIVVFIKHDPPKFLINNGREREALDAIHSIYHKDEKPGQIL